MFRRSFRRPRSFRSRSAFRGRGFTTRTIARPTGWQNAHFLIEATHDFDITPSYSIVELLAFRDRFSDVSALTITQSALERYTRYFEVLALRMTLNAYVQTPVEAAASNCNSLQWALYSDRVTSTGAPVTQTDWSQVQVPVGTVASMGADDQDFDFPERIHRKGGTLLPCSTEDFITLNAVNRVYTQSISVRLREKVDDDHALYFVLGGRNAIDVSRVLFTLTGSLWYRLRLGR